MKDGNGEWIDIWFGSGYCEMAVTSNNVLGVLAWTLTPAADLSDMSDELNLRFTTDNW